MTPWFLVTIGGLMYIGPLPEASCKTAAETLRGEGVVCMQPRAAMACPVPDHPGTYQVCPVFDFPTVTVKP